MNEQTQTGIEVRLHRGFLGWLFFFCRPVIVVDQKAYRKAWGGRYLFQLPAGEHTVAFFWRFLFVRRRGYRQEAITVQVGHVTYLQYTASGWAWYYGGHVHRKSSVVYRPMSKVGMTGRAVINSLGTSVVLFLLIVGLGLITEKNEAYEDAWPCVLGILLVLWLAFSITAVPYDYFRLKRSLADDSWKPETAKPPTGLQAFATLAAIVVAVAAVVSVYMGLLETVRYIQRPTGVSVAPAILPEPATVFSRTIESPKNA